MTAAVAGLALHFGAVVANEEPISASGNTPGNCGGSGTFNGSGGA